MFQTLDEQIKESEAEVVPASRTALRYLGVGAITLVIFSVLYMAMMWMEY